MNQRNIIFTEKDNKKEKKSVITIISSSLIKSFYSKRLPSSSLFSPSRISLLLFHYSSFLPRVLSSSGPVDVELLLDRFWRRNVTLLRSTKQTAAGR